MLLPILGTDPEMCPWTAIRALLHCVVSELVWQLCEAFPAYWFARERKIGSSALSPYESKQHAERYCSEPQHQSRMWRCTSTQGRLEEVSYRGSARMRALQVGIRHQVKCSITGGRCTHTTAATMKYTCLYKSTDCMSLRLPDYSAVCAHPMVCCRCAALPGLGQHQGLTPCSCGH